jgi:putative GTP pyrophosphokinase
MERDLEAFLKASRITANDWALCNISWGDLISIADDHESQRPSLEGIASMYANVVQRFSSVHSVRWRVKDTDHLVEKIIRKRANASTKYLDISVENYRDIIDDLIGIRAIHLFKSDFFDIDAAVRAVFKLKGEGIAFVRDGDSSELNKQYVETGLVVEEHPDNYRSIHYILVVQPFARASNIELQIRTIFEEGWSEIDHRVRYPNFSADPQLIYLLGIFNGMAGNADEMGGFIRKLANAQQDNNNELQEAVRTRKARISAIEEAIVKLPGETEERRGQVVAMAQDELKKLKEDVSSSHGGIVGTDVANWIAKYTTRRIESSVLHQQLGRMEEFSTSTSYRNAMAEHDALSKATLAARQLSAVAVAQRAFNDQYEAIKAVSGAMPPTAVEAAIMQMKEQEAMLKAVTMAMPPTAIEAAIKQMKEQETMTKAVAGAMPPTAVEAAMKKMKEQETMTKAVTGALQPTAVEAAVKQMKEQEAMCKAVTGAPPPTAVEAAMKYLRPPYI